MEYKVYQTTQLVREQGRKTRRMLLLSLVLLLTLPSSIAAATFFWSMHNYTVATAKQNETKVLGSLAAIMNAQRWYLYRHATFGTFAELHESGLVADDVKEDSTIAHGYLIKLTVVPGGVNDVPSYTLTADPLDSTGFLSATGHRHYFASSSDQVIRVNELRPATKDDPAVKQPDRSR